MAWPMVPFPYKDENPSASRRSLVIFIILLNILAVPWWNSAAFKVYGFLPGDPDLYRWFTSQFLHAGWLHLLGNMWFLWIFGDNVEARFGRSFLPFYLASGLAAAFVHMVMHPGSMTPTIGASGAVSGVIGAYLVLFPDARLRCFMLIIIKPWFFSMRAVWFGLLYVAWQVFMMWLSKGASGVAYGAHLGGAIFGMLAGAAWRMQREDEGLMLADEVPEHSASVPGGEQQTIERAIESGRVEEAVHAYARTVRRRPYFMLSEKCQLWMGDHLARLGYPHLAQAALERFTLRYPRGALTAHAELLRGYIAQTHFLDFPRASSAYERALAHPDSDPTVRADAGKRLAGVRRVLGGTFTHRPRASDHYWILLEGGPELSVTQLRSASRFLGRYEEQLALALRERPGVMASGLRHSEAAEAADFLERSGIPVVVLPQAAWIELPPVQLMTEIQIEKQGLRLVGPEKATAELEWKDLVLVAAVGLRHSARVVPFIEFLTLANQRFRWTPAPEMHVTVEAERNFFDSLQEVVHLARSVPVNRGACGAFHRELPAEAIHDEFPHLEEYMRWQLQLAHLRKQGTYRKWAEAVGTVGL
jgi:membrane associated rhomboid family serine protease